MLIKVFGIWINPRNIQFMYYRRADKDTFLTFTSGEEVIVADKTPDEVADEINNQLQTKERGE